MMAKQKDDFCEEDIVVRKKAIIDAYLIFLKTKQHLSKYMKRIVQLYTFAKYYDT